LTSITPGDLLIAPPAMADPRFKNSVLLITQHSSQGTQALCINKPSGHTVNEIVQAIDLELPQDVNLFWGGPVGLNTVWMVHDVDWAGDNTMRISEHWAMTSSMNMFHKITAGDRPKWFRVVMGLSSWAPGQLAMEMEGDGPFNIESSWLTAHAPTPEELLGQPPRDLWRNACDLSGNQAVSQWLA